MITKERLDEVSHLYAVGGCFSLSSPELAELIKLARLGLWVREYRETIVNALIMHTTTMFNQFPDLKPYEVTVYNAYQAMPKEWE